MAYRKMNAVQCKGARAMLGLSVRELAALADVSADTIVRLEKGEALMPRTVAAVRQALEAAGVEFLGAVGVKLRRPLNGGKK
jgi:transcriptional regulator with XRE-family HTH domain